jgi:uncharacterized hydrophobic protein (TIGR00271 family)
MTATTTAPSDLELVDARLSLGAASLDDLFPEGEAYRHSLITYSVLLTFAALVASFGLIQDSVAAIIGAMVIAPLGGAILAISGALVTGRTRWQWRSILQVLLSAVWVVLIGYGVGIVVPDMLLLTPSLDARTQPGLLDLGVALAAGGAGAFVAVRHTGSDALPGVAIAVSLVPPLATAGITMEMGRLDDAAGALLLFTTNLAAIVVVATIVFAMSGAIPSADRINASRRIRRGLAVAVVAMVLISIPLIWQSARSVADSLTANRGAPIVAAWIGIRDLEVTAYDIDGDKLQLVVAGSELPTDVPALAASLAKALGHPVELTVEYVPRVQVKATGE